MSCKFADRLYILKHTGKGLQARLHSLHVLLANGLTRPSVLKDLKLDKTRKLIEKKFVDGTGDVIQVLEDPNASGRIAEELKQPYLTLVDVVKFKQHAFSLLKQAAMVIRDEIPDVAFASQVVNGFLSLFTTYVQIQIQLVETIPERRLVVALYEAGTSEEFPELRSYLLSLGNEPFEFIQQEFMGDVAFTATMRNALTCIANAHLGCIDIKSLAKSGIFCEVQPGELNQFLPFMFAEETDQWVCFAGICCPNAFLGEDNMLLVALLRTAFQKCYKTEVFREHSISVYEKMQKLPATNQMCPELIKLIADVGQYAISETGYSDAKERRMFLLHCLETCLKQISHFPGLLGPKILQVFALLSLGKNEIFSFLRHFPGRNGISDHHRSIISNGMGKLIYLHLRLVDLVHKHGDIVTNYCHESLEVEGVALKALLNERLLGDQAIPDDVLQLVQDLSNQLELQNRSSAEICALCRRVEAAILLSQNAEPAGSLSTSLTNSGNYNPGKGWRSGILHVVTRISIQAQLAHQTTALLTKCSLGNVLFHGEALESTLKDVLDNSVDIGTSLAFISVLNDSMSVLHPFNPEETRPLCDHATVLSSKLLLQIIKRMDSLMSQFFMMSMEVLEQPLQPVLALKRSNRQKEAKTEPGLAPPPVLSINILISGAKAGAKAAAESAQTLSRQASRAKMKFDLPGTESKTKKNNKTMTKFAQVKRNVVELSNALGMSAPIFVWDRKYHPQQFLRTLLEDWFRAKVHAAFIQARHPQLIRPPSETEIFLNTAIDIIRLVCPNEIDYQRLVENILSNQTKGAKHVDVDFDETDSKNLKIAAKAHETIYSNNSFGDITIVNERTSRVSDIVSRFFNHYVEFLCGTSANASAMVHSHDLGNSTSSFSSVTSFNMGSGKNSFESGKSISGASDSSTSSRGRKNQGFTTNPETDGIAIHKISNRCTSDSTWSIPQGQGLGVPGIIYSPHCRAYVKVRGLHPKKRLAASNGRVFDAGQWLSQSELLKLVRLIGPTGVRVVDRNLLAIVSTQAKRIQVALQSARGSLETFKAAVKKSPNQSLIKIATNGTLRDPTSIILAALVTAGHALILRDQLHEMLVQIFQNDHDYIHSALCFGEKHIRRSMTGDERAQQLLNNIGRIDLGSDHGLRTILAPILADHGVANLWDLLPLALTASMCQDVWRTSKPVDHRNALMNNAHVAPIAMLKFLSSIYPLIADLEQISDGESWKPKVGTAFLLHVSSAVKLHNELVTNVQFKDWSSQGIVLYLEHTIHVARAVVPQKHLLKHLPLSMISAVNAKEKHKYDRTNLIGSTIGSIAA